MHNLKVIPTEDNKYILTEDYYYKYDLVPKGYKTNGADIPRIFWWFVPPFKPKYLPAVIVHDYLCDQGNYEYADSVFQEMLLEIEDSFATRTMVRAVKLHTKYIKEK